MWMLALRQSTLCRDGQLGTHIKSCGIIGLAALGCVDNACRVTNDARGRTHIILYVYLARYASRRPQSITTHHRKRLSLTPLLKPIDRYLPNYNRILRMIQWPLAIQRASLVSFPIIVKNSVVINLADPFLSVVQYIDLLVVISRVWGIY